MQTFEISRCLWDPYGWQEWFINWKSSVSTMYTKWLVLDKTESRLRGGDRGGDFETISINRDDINFFHICRTQMVINFNFFIRLFDNSYFSASTWPGSRLLSHAHAEHFSSHTLYGGSSEQTTSKITLVVDFNREFVGNNSALIENWISRYKVAKQKREE